MTSYPYVVVIDEPGMGYAEPCWSWQEALRSANEQKPCAAHLGLWGEGCMINRNGRTRFTPPTTKFGYWINVATDITIFILVPLAILFAIGVMIQGAIETHRANVQFLNHYKP